MESWLQFAVESKPASSVITGRQDESSPFAAGSPHWRVEGDKGVSKSLFAPLGTEVQVNCAAGLFSNKGKGLPRASSDAPAHF